jgi:cysteine desulfurase|nr:MAG TPA: Cysteine sulfinate desulfinase/cysteine desulfurase [Caudoviricetes sp.]
MVYLDHSATSYPVRYFAKDYYIPGNPNSPHALGLQANRALNVARDRIKKCLGVRSGKVLFCRCATEAVEWLCGSFNGLYVSTLETNCSIYEHDSVRDCCYNIWNFNDATNSMRPDSIYLHQHTNQITGSVFPIESIGKQVQSTGAFFGSDLTASIGHYKLPDNLDSFCSVVWFSGHKFGCEPGIGAIWLSDRLFKYLGGSEDNHNEYDLLHGTPNVSDAVAMSYAMEHAISHAEDNNKRYLKLVSHLFDKLINEHNIAATLVGQDKPKTHAINAVYLPGFNADALVQYLSSKGIYISPGYSACATHSEDASRVLEAFGLTKEEASQTVRISFGLDTSMEDIDALVDGIVEFKKLFI